MDFFGIGAAVAGAVEVYFRSARRTGRTTALIESLRAGDRVVFISHNRAREFERKCRERGLNVVCLHIPVSFDGMHELRIRCRHTTARTIFDHEWIEEYYRERIQVATDCLAALEVELSGRLIREEKSELAAANSIKWREGLHPRG